MNRHHPYSEHPTTHADERRREGWDAEIERLARRAPPPPPPPRGKVLRLLALLPPAQ